MTTTPRIKRVEYANKYHKLNRTLIWRAISGPQATCLTPNHCTLCFHLHFKGSKYRYGSIFQYLLRWQFIWGESLQRGPLLDCSVQLCAQTGAVCALRAVLFWPAALHGQTSELTQTSWNFSVTSLPTTLPEFGSSSFHFFWWDFSPCVRFPRKRGKWNYTSHLFKHTGGFRCSLTCGC